MRRLLSIALLLLLALPLVSPALGQTPGARVLLCCRKGGDHHCMSMASPTGAPMVHERCPSLPTGSVVSHAAGCLVTDTFLAASSHSAQPLKLRQVEVGYRISFLRSRHKRGPPAPLVS